MDFAGDSLSRVTNSGFGPIMVAATIPSQGEGDSGLNALDARSGRHTFAGHLGATPIAGGVQFAVHAAKGGTAQLLLFDTPDAADPAQVINLDPTLHRTASYWHITVPNVGNGQVYNWRISAQAGRPSAQALLDPYGLAITGWQNYDRQAARTGEDNTAHALRSVVVDLGRFDWQDDAPPPRIGREFIYELHVGAFTADPSSGLAADLRGTYAGLAARVDHLLQLGVTAVELMPVHAFDPQDAPTERVNYWGYSPVSYFAPHAGYAAAADATEVLDEFRDMVRVLHAAGLRVILDVVYNHTAEAGPDGPILSWRGFDEAAYYMQEKDFSLYRDFTGCGNTFNANHPVVSRLITDSLRHWVTHLHVDGFRFDLAAAMARDEDGQPLSRPPVLWAIDSDPALAGTRLIAEAWDAGGLHLVGDFPGDRFACWNGPYRDTVRRFGKGDSGVIEDLMARIVGSPDLFASHDARPSDSINFVTCHDGFTLRDLVTYDQKSNWENGEDNRDGSNHNLSWHSGAEGPSDDPKIIALRERRIRNFLTLLFFSHGTPMLLAGDEWGQTRQGNNNPWCLDNERNWLAWNLAQDNADLLRFVRLTARLANHLPVLVTDRYWTATNPDREGDITWHGLQPNRPDWTATSRHLAYELIPPRGSERVLVLLNTEAVPRSFALVVPPPGTSWCRVIDTAAPAPDDIQPEIILRQQVDGPITVASHTVVVLLAQS